MKLYFCRVSRELCFGALSSVILEISTPKKGQKIEASVFHNIHNKETHGLPEKLYMKYSFFQLHFYTIIYVCLNFGA